jgi:hypothetical protein
VIKYNCDEQIVETNSSKANIATSLEPALLVGQGSKPGSAPFSRQLYYLRQIYHLIILYSILLDSWPHLYYFPLTLKKKSKNIMKVPLCF